jgi:hypothetical protein
VCDATVSFFGEALLAFLTGRTLTNSAVLHELVDSHLLTTIIVTVDESHGALLSKVILNLGYSQVHGATLVRAEEGSFIVSLSDERMHLLTGWGLTLAFTAVAFVYLAASLEGHAVFANSALAFRTLDRVNGELLAVGTLELREDFVLAGVE